MDATVDHVQNASEFDDLFDVLMEYERSLEPDLRHGEEPTRAALEAIYCAPNAAFLASVDGGVAGCVVATELDASSIVLQRLYARPAFRNHGIGRTLIGAVLAYARGRGYRRVVLDTDKERLSGAYRLYLALGFTECEPFAAVDYRHPIYMERRL